MFFRLPVPYVMFAAYARLQQLSFTMRSFIDTFENVRPPRAPTRVFTRFPAATRHAAAFNRRVEAFAHAISYPRPALMLSRHAATAVTFRRVEARRERCRSSGGPAEAYGGM